MSEQSVAKGRCSWPAVVFLPLVLVLLIPTFVDRGSFTETQFMRILVGLFIARWGLAIVRKERGRDWLLYLFLLITVPAAVYSIAGMLGR